ncbi:unnamed protein product, partial [Ascophyllum nodosum]
AFFFSNPLVDKTRGRPEEVSPLCFQEAGARDQCVAFSDVGRGKRDVPRLCNSGEVQLGTKERAEIPEPHAGLPVQAQAPLDLVTCLDVDA